MLKRLFSWLLVLSLFASCTGRGVLETPTELSKKGVGELEYEIKDGYLIIKTSKLNKNFLELPLEKTFLQAGKGEPKVGYRMAAFSFKDKLTVLCESGSIDSITHSTKSLELKGKLKGSDCNSDYSINFKLENPKTLSFEIKLSDKTLNRTYFFYGSDNSEQFFGFGEQNTNFNMKGKKPFLFTEEQGIGRGDQPITFAANVNSGAGGNEHTSYAPIPHYITTKNRSVFFENTSYSKFDLENENEVGVMFWENGMKGTIWVGESPLELIESYTAKTGRFPELPEWAYGTWLGVQAGEIQVEAWNNQPLRGYAKLNKIIEDAEKAGNPIRALWIQDWCGRRITNFGDQLKWRWYADDEMYPDLKKYIAELNKKNIKVMGYINSFLADKDPKKVGEKFENPQLEEAKAKGYLVKNKEGKDYLIQTVGFPAYLIDLTNPAAVKWTKEIIKKNMIDLGLSGWMADFGEWLPFDAVMHNGMSGELYHNIYPVEWAKLNREAIVEARKEGQIVFFTRAGYSYSNKYSTAFWEGDQMVSFQEHDGLPSTIVGLTTSGISGLAINHSDIGGYTTIKFPWYFPAPHYYRPKELFLRWAEMSAFTPIYRTHEGNRPKPNHQPYTDKETIEFFAKFGKIHYSLSEYLKFLSKEAKTKGHPFVRALYLHYPEDPNTYNLKFQYLLGEDMLVLPVVKKGENEVEGYFPKGEWKHLFTGEIVKGGMTKEVKAPLGTPAVYVKVGGVWSEKIYSSVQQSLK
ncbi:MAG: alpha-glucosidase [Leptospiraceae bacterium]|nr:alpha-glucosidase [Leptospiraceae bacterium]